MKRSLTAIALRRPITVIMLVITMLGLGGIAYVKIPVEFIPKLDMPFIRCYIPYVGATPAQVENEVAIPAEGEFRTVSQMKRITTTSDSNGCDVRMTFEWDADMALATSEVRDRMERLKLELPDEIERLFLRRFSSTSLPIMAFALFRDGDHEELTNLVRNLLQSRLLRLDGVADVMVFGAPEKEVLIEFDQERLNSLNLTLYEVVGRLRSSSLNLSLGELGEADTKYLVRAQGEFTSPEEMARLVVSGNHAVRLSDVADVGYQARERETEFSIDGKGGIFVLVRKESEANTIATCRALRHELDMLETDPLFKGTEAFMFIDQSELILTTLKGLLQAGKWGGSLALLVLLLFLRRIRSTFVVALAIPSSVVVALVFMFFAGMTLNVVTMISMTIALGMLVDNSIVVIENIYRHAQLGFDAEESARRGASEVGLAITAATLTTVVVFIPILYLETGEMATYMRQFAVPVTVALGASLLIALTVIPLAVRHMKPRHRMRSLAFLRPLFASAPAGEPGRFARLFRFHPLKRLMAFYGRLLAWTVRWRLATLLAVFGMILLTLAVPYRLLGRQGMPSMDSREIEVDIVLDQNFDMAKATETFKTLQGVIAEQREELGIKNVFSHHQAGGGSLYIYLLQPEDLADGEEFPFTTEEVRDILWQRLPGRVPGGELRFSIAEASESTQRGFALRMRGDDAEVLNGYAERFKELLGQIPNVSDVMSDTDRDEQEVQIGINETMATECGISPLVIARTVDFALRGTKLSYLKREGREIPVWAQFREEDRKTRANLDNVHLLSRTGELVPLSRLVTVSRARSPQAIRRVDGKNVVTIAAKTVHEDLSGVMRDLKELIESFDMPQGYTVEMGDELMELEANASNFATALIMAVILIYLVMGALFESYVLPLSILTSVPLAFIGVYWIMWLTNTPMDTVSMIGAILMVGIVVNNGIVIVDHINQLRQRGCERTEALLQAGHDRFRPVMMTALTTILGCVPLALGSSLASDIAFSGLGRALIGGLTTGTLLTLFIVPVFYTLIDDARSWLLRFFGGLVRLGSVNA
ncbi:MAG: efflux RND transporter permease subunit [Candidatus Hydrogenedentes bacterium]|nr:efflux RND transporter permease subunit [Candidatus Hydrogenedentota bacterium]